MDLCPIFSHFCFCCLAKVCPNEYHVAEAGTAVPYVQQFVIHHINFAMAKKNLANRPSPVKQHCVRELGPCSQP